MEFLVSDHCGPVSVKGLNFFLPSHMLQFSLSESPFLFEAKEDKSSRQSRHVFENYYKYSMKSCQGIPEKVCTLFDNGFQI